MATFIGLTNWTDEGIRTRGETIERMGLVLGLLHQVGGKDREFFWTIGPYDMVVVFDVPDDRTAAAYSLSLATQENIRCTAMRSFNRGELRQSS